MESIGEKLKTAREALGYSIEHIARDTNIAKKYLAALEKEDFSVFPGIPYLKGFLRNYAEYLSLDGDEMISLYDNTILQEQPAPMDELLNTGRHNFLKVLVPLLLGIAVLIAGALIVGLLLNNRTAPVDQTASGKEPESSEIKIYTVSTEPFSQRIRKGDQLQVALGNRDYKILVKDISDKLILTLPSGAESSMKIGDALSLDLNNDSIIDIDILLNDIDIGNPEGGAKIQISKVEKANSSADITAEGEKVKDTPSSPGPSPSGQLPGASESVQPTAARNPGAGLVASEQEKVISLETAASPHPFKLRVEFLGYCLIRYVADGQAVVEEYFHKGQVLEATVNRDLRVWISNAGSLRAKIDGKPVDFGHPGAVAAKSIQWIKDEDSDRYRLKIIPMY